MLLGVTVKQHACSGKRAELRYRKDVSEIQTHDEMCKVPIQRLRAGRFEVNGLGCHGLCEPDWRLHIPFVGACQQKHQNLCLRRCANGRLVLCQAVTEGGRGKASRKIPKMRRRVLAVVCVSRSPKRQKNSSFYQHHTRRPSGGGCYGGWALANTLEVGAMIEACTAALSSILSAQKRQCYTMSGP
ncbi:hypothetical protein B0H67DRAFT_591477 [Lasiosphaeris hirsuta]|uniref:Uncharacterized protein n=1 Tax=Lasiosphaeris hirsuta TaxID=260670 RepID=A0AA39ZVM6_9PEZI|nr:hypothetical protein B0H67DRAFT_591477 [Lasiosphaeris hirsuta]